MIRSANDFLKQLSAENYGRYHRSSKTDRDIHLFAHKILTEGVQDSYVGYFFKQNCFYSLISSHFILSSLIFLILKVMI